MSEFSWDNVRKIWPYEHHLPCELLTLLSKQGIMLYPKDIKSSALPIGGLLKVTVSVAPGVEQFRQFKKISIDCFEEVY